LKNRPVKQKKRWCRSSIIIIVQGGAAVQVINAFSAQNDAEMKAKVITRLCNVTDLHQLLNKSLAGNV